MGIMSNQSAAQVILTRINIEFELPHLLQIQVRQNGTSRGFIELPLVAVLHVKTKRSFSNRKVFPLKL